MTFFESHPYDKWFSRSLQFKRIDKRIDSAPSIGRMRQAVKIRTFYHTCGNEKSRRGV